MSESIPQSIDGYIEQLSDKEPKLRYEAIHYLALIPLGDRYREAYDAVWARTEDANPRIRWAAGIAASMMSARQNPYSIFNINQNMPSEINNLAADVPKDNLGIPDFLGEWQE